MKKYSLTTIKRMTENYTSTRLEPNDFILKYSLFLSEITPYSYIWTHPYILEDGVKQENGTVVFDLPEDFAKMESVILMNTIATTYGDNGIALTKTSLNSFNSTNHTGYNKEYYIWNNKIYIQGQDEKMQVKVYYYKNLIAEQWEILQPNITAAERTTPLNLDEIEYALENDFADMAALYITYKYWSEQKNGAVANFFLSQYIMKRNEYDSRIKSERESSTSSQMETTREYW